MSQHFLGFSSTDDHLIISDFQNGNFQLRVTDYEVHPSGTYRDFVGKIENIDEIIKALTEIRDRRQPALDSSEASPVTAEGGYDELFPGVWVVYYRTHSGGERLFEILSLHSDIREAVFNAPKWDSAHIGYAAFGVSIDFALNEWEDRFGLEGMKND